MTKFSQTCSNLILCLCDFWNYINGIYEDGTSIVEIKKIYSKLKDYKSKLILLKGKCKE